MFTLRSNIFLKLISTSVLLNCCIYNLHAQSFCESYKLEIKKSQHRRRLDKSEINSINDGISDLRKTLRAFEKRHGYSILRHDTVFMIDLDAPIHYKIIWDGKESCY